MTEKKIVIQWKTTNMTLEKYMVKVYELRFLLDTLTKKIHLSAL